MFISSISFSSVRQLLLCNSSIIANIKKSANQGQRPDTFTVPNAYIYKQ